MGKVFLHGQEILFENDNLTMLQLILAKTDFPEGEALNYLARFQFYGDEVQKNLCIEWRRASPALSGLRDAGKRRLPDPG